jgi:hypothetical protein
MMKCAVPGTQVRKYSHNTLPLVHTHFLSLQLQSLHKPSTPRKTTFGMKCVFFSLSTIFVPDILPVFTPFHNIPSPCTVCCYCPVWTKTEMYLDFQQYQVSQQPIIITCGQMDGQAGRQKVKQPTGTCNNLLLWMYQIQERSKMTSIWRTSSLPPRTIEQGHCGIWELSTAIPVRPLIVLVYPLSWLSTCTVANNNSCLIKWSTCICYILEQNESATAYTLYCIMRIYWAKIHVSAL